MIEILAVLIAISVLSLGYYTNRSNTSTVACKIWVQENPSTDWICVDQSK